MRQAEAMATLYKEIQEMVKRIAQWRKMNYVVKVSNQPITGTDPNSVMAAISSTLVYADPRNDITNDVIYQPQSVLQGDRRARGQGRRRGRGARPAGRQSPAGGTETERSSARRRESKIGLLEPADRPTGSKGPFARREGRPWTGSGCSHRLRRARYWASSEGAHEGAGNAQSDAS